MKASKLLKGVLNADQHSHIMEERIAYASQFVVQVQVVLKSGIIYPECIIISDFAPNTSTEFDIVFPNSNGVSKRIQVLDVASFVILNSQTT